MSSLQERHMNVAASQIGGNLTFSKRHNRGNTKCDTKILAPWWIAVTKVQQYIKCVHVGSRHNSLD